MSLDKNLKTILLKIGNKYRKKEYDGSHILLMLVIKI